jgi:S-disulfanyl-L-cysteine oxidoreductase SoxD
MALSLRRGNDSSQWRKREVGKVHKRIAILIIIVVAFAGIAGFAQTQNEGRKTVWEGVYTAEQATRGQDEFVRSCSGCHGDPNDYRQVGPGFRGTAFMERWREYNAGALFNIIRDTMPRDRPGALTDGAYLDIVARLFQVNSFPPGMQELKVEDLKKIQIEGKEGPKPVPDKSLVQLVGCLTQDDKNAWLITKGSEPARTERLRGSTAEELEQAKVKKLGEHTFQLLYLDSLSGFTPDSHKGHKMQVKGNIVRFPDRQRIDLTSMEMISENCE